MTVDSSQSSAPEPTDAPPLPGTVASTATPYLVTSVGFLVLAVLAGLDAAVQLLFPDLFSGVAFMSFGRLLPLATDAFIYGWLTIGLAGGLLFVVGRSGRTEVGSERQARLALILLAVGVAAGSVSLALGFNHGAQYFEYPLLIDAVILVGMIAFARVLGAMARAAAVDTGPVRWYAVTAAWSLPLAFVVGNVPGVVGVAGAAQGAFARTVLIGLWIVPASLAVVYHLIARITGRETFPPTRLTLLGFWSLAFVWALTAPAALVYAAVPDWLETVGGIFSIGLLIPVAVILTDMVIGLRRRWEDAAGHPSLRFVVLGAGLFAVWPFANLALAMRSSSGIIQYTDWVAGAAVIGIFGAFTAWLIGFAHYAAPKLMGSGGGRRIIGFQYYAILGGLLVWAGSSFLAGITAGWTWVATANEAAVPQAGVGFVNTLAGVEGFYVAAFVGQALYGLGILAFVVGVLSRRELRPVVPGRDSDDADPDLALTTEISPLRLRAGTVGLFVAAAVVVWLVPWAETAGVQGTILADTARDYPAGSAEADGRQVYLSEGCWYCHTQQVRPIVTDVGLGAVSTQGDFAHESPVLFGVQRIGPDLMHVGAREPTNDPTWLAGYLADPRSERTYSIMPSYDYLSQTDLDNLAAYLAGLK